MIEKHNENGQEFCNSVKDQLYIETFAKDTPEFSLDRVETLVKMIELDEGSDEQEVEEAHARFDRKFLELASDGKKGKRKAHYRKAVRTAAAMLVIVLLADVTSHAVMDKSLFHVLNLWTNQMAILPGESEAAETTVFREYDTRIFTEVKDFAEQFDNNFLVCSWLPEGVEFRTICSTKASNSNNYVWEYGSEEKNSIINIRMFEKVENDVAGLTGTQLEDGKKIEFANGISATICVVNSSECLAAFDYCDWWYMVYVDGDEEFIKSVVGGMKKYE